MNVSTLEKLLDTSKRKDLFDEILNKLQDLDGTNGFTCELHKISEGTIPVVYFNKQHNTNEVQSLKIFIGAQHNEYNGLFGILNVLDLLKNEEISHRPIINKRQILAFFPIMNPYGFLNPRKDNKSGYFLKNGSNLNRFWRRTFVPGFEGNEADLIDHPIPEHAILLKKLIKPYWDNEKIAIYIIDFHETSLLERFPKELSMNLSPYYKFDHWLKESIVENVMRLYDIKSFREPLFFKCNNSADHNHLNLSFKQVEKVREKLFEFMAENRRKLPFYLVHSKKSKEPCTQLSIRVLEKLGNILWKTAIAVHDHEFHDHGCLVRMNDVAKRENLFCVELENQKQFFDLFEEKMKSTADSEYFQNKLETVNKTIELIKETIIETIRLP
ncbi:MAG: hypothetical protein JW891_05465 [Candidatus Lokiarchaeota archaeon]|nr:hypothetical protein [Candidatus Lokiarchaeota archaeon]